MSALADYGIHKRHIQLALDAFKQGTTIGKAGLSKSTYIVDHHDNTLWDLKVAVVLAGQLTNPPAGLVARDFITHKFIPDLIKMGYPILRFEVERSRNLGLRGYEPTELIEQHVVLEPFTGNEITNAFSPRTLDSLTSAEIQRRAASGMRYVRNSNHVRVVLRRANGFCAKCNRESFITPAGNKFLEVHHKKWLREGGPDHPNNMVALCPNCHRQEHHGVERRFK